MLSGHQVRGLEVEFHADGGGDGFHGAARSRQLQRRIDTGIYRISGFFSSVLQTLYFSASATININSAVLADDDFRNLSSATRP